MSSRNIKAKALQIKTETQARANSANRVGGLFEDIADELVDLANSVAAEATRATGKEQELESGITAIEGKVNESAGLCTISYSENYKEVCIDDDGNIYSSIDHEDKKHEHLDHVFHGNVKVEGDFDAKDFKDSSAFKYVGLDENGRIYECIDPNDKKHEYLNTIFEGDLEVKGKLISEQTKKETLKILVIGNSFSYDGVDYLDDFISASGETDGITIYYIGLGGSSLEFWSGVANSDNAINTFSSGSSTPSMSVRIGTDLGFSTNNSMKQVFAADWDYLVIQQVSDKYIDYTTYKPYLCKILTSFRENCINRQSKIAWQMVWSRGTNASSSADLKMEEGWNNIVTATKQLEEDFSRQIDVIIPTGTAVQNARNSTENPSAGDFTRDWHHLANGFGIWLAGACWYEQLIAPFNGVSIVDFDCLINVSQSTIDSAYSNYGTVVGSVTDSNIAVLKKCVMYALSSYYEIIKN